MTEIEYDSEQEAHTESPSEADSDLQPEPSPEIQPKVNHMHTESMMTVRLSDLGISVGPNGADKEVQVPVSRPASRPVSMLPNSRPQSNLLDSGRNESVDWEILEKTEEQESKDDATDESTALLLARLEKENAALATNPKSAITSKTTTPTNENGPARPMSVQYLKKLVEGPQRESLRYSLLPPPPMTELEFWAALVQDYPQTALRLPTLTSNKIRGGIPPPLRGVVWPSIAGTHESELHEAFEKLANEPSPYDGLIGKDVGRSFPNVEMFREKDGEGQQMLGRVLKAFSLYDDQIGYCQGLGFVVGPLLMHMNDTEAFCILVRLMEHYELRSCYLPDLSGLHLRIFQFQALLRQHLPELSAHLDDLGVEPLYVSNWFLSFFAVTCPLPMLLRIWDVILSEGAPETLMRVALSLMQRNQPKLMSFTEFEEVMSFLLSRSLWDTYAQHADDLVADFVSLTALVSPECLESLEMDYKPPQNPSTTTSLKKAASSFLGRFWAGSSQLASKSGNLSLMIPGANSNTKELRKSSSGHSLTSTVNSLESSMSEGSTAPTEVTEDVLLRKADSRNLSTSEASPSHSSDRDLHHQIEDLLTALSKMQHEQVELVKELQREREEREEDREVGRQLLFRLRQQTTEIQELAGDEPADEVDEADELFEKAEFQFRTDNSRRVSIIQSKHQLQDAAAEWKEKHDQEVSRCQELIKRLDAREAEHAALKEHLREARAHVQDAQKEKSRLERTVQDLRANTSPGPSSPYDMYTPVNEVPEPKFSPAKPGLREFKLGKPEPKSQPQATFSKRVSSLGVQGVFTAASNEPISNDALLVELVNAKTSEAMARQELEETRSKLDALRKIVSGTTTSPSGRGSALEFAFTRAPSPGAATKESPKTAHTPSASTGGFFAGWGKRSS